MNDRKKTRSVSEETQIRKLLSDLTDHILELKEKQRVDNLLIKGELADIKADVTKLRGADVRRKTQLSGVAMLAGDALNKVNDLHQKLIGSSDDFGKRLHALERGNSAGGKTTGRSPGR